MGKVSTGRPRGSAVLTTNPFGLREFGRWGVSICPTSSWQEIQLLPKDPESFTYFPRSVGTTAICVFIDLFPRNTAPTRYLPFAQYRSQALRA